MTLSARLNGAWQVITDGNCSGASEHCEYVKTSMCITCLHSTLAEVSTLSFLQLLS